MRKTAIVLINSHFSLPVKRQIGLKALWELRKSAATHVPDLGLAAVSSGKNNHTY